MKNKFVINSDFKPFIEAFAEQNSKVNLVSKNDEKLLFEKHIYDSLSLNLFLDKYNIKSGKILDIGCGGGFPSIPLAIELKDFNITAVDSIQKKINAVTCIREELGLENLHPICGRIEELRLDRFDIVVSRAVADLSKISEYALPHLKKGGYFVAYKSKKTDEETENAKPVLKKYNAKIIDIIEYTLPLDEIYERKLVCIKK